MLERNDSGRKSTTFYSPAARTDRRLRTPAARPPPAATLHDHQKPPIDTHSRPSDKRRVRKSVDEVREEQASSISSRSRSLLNGDFQFLFSGASNRWSLFFVRLCVAGNDSEMNGRFERTEEQRTRCCSPVAVDCTRVSLQTVAFS